MILSNLSRINYITWLLDIQSMGQNIIINIIFRSLSRIIRLS